MKELRVKTPSVWTEAIYLSGGNQQKVVWPSGCMPSPGRLHSRRAHPRHRRGLPSPEIYGLLSDLAKQGMAIIVVSSEIEEIVGRLRQRGHHLRGQEDRTAGPSRR